MVTPIGPTAGIVEVVPTAAWVVVVVGAVVEGETPDVVEGETPDVVEVVFVDTVVLVTTVELVVGTGVVVVTVASVEVVVELASTVNKAVAQG